MSHSQSSRPVPHPPRTWRLRDTVLPLRRPLVMGILNVTPDSFSDGGRHATFEAAVACGLRMVAEGADILDVGGESTRPGADPVPAEEECRRVVPVVRALRECCPGTPVSVDTHKAAVAAAALEAGAEIVNDVRALADPAMAGVVRDAQAGLVLMHSRGTPRTMSRENHYADVARDVAGELAERAALAERSGVARDRICLDPGFGFAKVGLQNYALLRGLDRVLALGYPVLVGASRKSFIGLAISLPWDASADAPPCAVRPPAERLAGSLAFAVAAVLRGAHVLRVHDVAETCDAARVALQCASGEA
jgi:dihydropteroate synthase